MERRIINPWMWQDQFGFVQANEVTDFKRVVLCAGIISVDQNGKPLHAGSMEMQIKQIFNNLETLLDQADTDFSKVVRLMYYTTDVQQFKESSPVLVSLLEKYNCKPATTLLGVASLSFPECVIEIDATVVT